MGATLATVTKVMKEIYEGKGVEDQLNDETITLSRLKKSSKGITNQVGGKYVTFPIGTKRNTGIGARNEMEMLPAAGQQGTEAVKIGLKYLYGSLQLTGQTLRLVDSDYNSFASALDLEVNGLISNIATDMNRQVYGNGKGTIGTVVAVSGTPALNDNKMSVDEVKYFQEDMAVDIFAANDTLVAAGRVVTAINFDTKIITVSGAVLTPTAGQYFTRAGNQNREWTGLGAIVNNTGALYGVDPATVGVWKARVDANGGVPRAVSEGIFTSMSDSIRRASGGIPSAIFTTLGVRRQYADLLMTTRSFVNTTEFTGGFKHLAFDTDKGPIPMVVDDNAPTGTAWFISEKNIKIYQEAEWGWMDYDGNKFKQLTDYDAYIARRYQYSELGTNRRNSHGVIKDLQE